jgi:hypothetical protein
MGEYLADAAGLTSFEGGRMIDPDTYLARIAGMSYKEIIRELELKGDGYHAPAHAGERKRPANYSQSDAYKDEARVGRLLYFLRHGSSAQPATAADMKWCSLVRERLAAKSDWPHA